MPSLTLNLLDQARVQMDRRFSPSVSTTRLLALGSHYFPVPPPPLWCGPPLLRNLLLPPPRRRATLFVGIEVLKRERERETIASSLYFCGRLCGIPPFKKKLVRTERPPIENVGSKGTQETPQGAHGTPRKPSLQ